MNIGILCPSEIAYRRFLPALNKISGVKFVGVAINTPNERYGNNLPSISEVEHMLAQEKAKALRMRNDYGGELFEGYKSIIASPDIDAVYIPLPPALHYEWTKRALECGKHVLVEKPATTSKKETQRLIEIAKKNNLALHENYMFVFHNQLQAINTIIENNEIGDIRLFRISFGFPRRLATDFRYNRALGGGALLDAGGYTIRYAAMLLGDTAQIKHAHLNYIPEFEVDMFGSATLENATGVTAQIAFGMDNDYKCELEVWGSNGTFKTGRVLTAPDGYIPSSTISKNNVVEKRELPSDDAFKKSIEYFIKCIGEPSARNCSYENMIMQADLVDQFLSKARL